MKADRTIDDERGFALVAAIAIVVIGGMTLTLLMNLGARESAAVVGELESAQAFYITQAGLEYSLVMGTVNAEPIPFAGGEFTTERGASRITATGSYRDRARRLGVSAPTKRDR